jgi:hypothetical protein
MYSYSVGTVHIVKLIGVLYTYILETPPSPGKYQMSYLGEKCKKWHKKKRKEKGKKSEIKGTLKLFKSVKCILKKGKKKGKNRE